MMIWGETSGTCLAVFVPPQEKGSSTRDVFDRALDRE